MDDDHEHAVERAATTADLSITGEALPEIDVTIRAGKAILIGMVRTWQERRVAEQAAWAFPAVCEIDDRLVVVSTEQR